MTNDKMGYICKANNWNEVYKNQVPSERSKDVEMGNEEDNNNNWNWQKKLIVTNQSSIISHVNQWSRMVVLGP